MRRLILLLLLAPALVLAAEQPPEEMPCLDKQPGEACDFGGPGTCVSATCRRTDGDAQVTYECLRCELHPLPLAHPRSNCTTGAASPWALLALFAFGRRGSRCASRRERHSARWRR